MRNAHLLVNKVGAIRAGIPVLSNVFVLPAIFLAYRSKEWSVFYVLSNVFAVSSLYHLCDSFGYCVVDFHSLFWLDHFFAFMAFVVLTVFCMNICNVEHRYILLLVLAEVTVLTYVAFGISLTSLTALIVLLSLMFIGRWFYGGVPYFNWVDAMIAGILLAFGLILFVFFNNNAEHYWWVHSLWHASILLTAYFVLEIKRPPPAPCFHVPCKRCNRCHHCLEGKCTLCRHISHTELHSHWNCAHCKGSHHHDAEVVHPISVSHLPSLLRL